MASPLRVLVVDDAESFRTLVTMVLERSDRYEPVGEAGEGDAAVEAARELTPDLVLLDVNLPGDDGFDVLERLRKAAPDARVVVVSGHDAERLEAAAREAGAAGYIEKSGDPETLLAALDELTPSGEGTG
jgi:DNA-binding NarL/FixJ family response regulator